jgi:cytochrome c2
VLIVLAVVLVLIGGFVAYIAVDGIPTYSVKKIHVSIETTPARVSRGKKIVGMLRAECHMNPATGYLTGHRLVDVPAEFGTLYSRNITNDKKFGIGAWSDEDIVYLLRTGVKPSGQYAPPYMVKLPHASDEDLYSIVSYLRSDDSLVRPQAIQDTECKPTLLVKFLSHVAFKPFDYPSQPISAPDMKDRIAYGKYLADDLISCYACHSADFKTMDVNTPSKSEGFYGGNNELLDLGAKKIYSANITPDKQTGIGTWSERDFDHALRGGFRPNNTPLRYPMSPLPELTEEEVGDIYAYLQTVPTINKATKKSEEYLLTGANITAGQRIYYKYSCYSCHGTEGVGVCDLRKGYLHYPTNDSLTTWIKHPSKIVPGTKMPDWAGVIQEAEYTPLCEYVRLLGERGMKGATALK